MAQYAPKTWVTGEIITAIELNAIEQAAGAALPVADIPTSPDLRAAYVGKVTPEQFGAKGDNVTDDTAAIQEAHDFLEAQGGGVLSFGNKTYRLDSAPRHDRGGNAIIALGQHPSTGGPSVVWEGVSPQENYWPSVGGGTVLRCTRTSDTYSATYGPPAVIGGQTRENTDPTNLDPFSYMQLTLRNIAVQVPNNPAVAAIDLRYVGRAEIHGTIAIAETADSNAVAPSHKWAFGLRMPGKNNWNKSVVISGGAYGFYCGFIPEEHISVLYWSQKWCVIGTGLQGGGSGHVMTALNISSEWCAYHIAGYSETAGVTPLPNLMWLAVHTFDIEDSPAVGMYPGSGGWFETVTHINDSANNLLGFVNYSRIRAGYGNRDTLLLAGAGKLKVYDLNAPRSDLGKQIVIDTAASPLASSGGAWTSAANSAAYYGVVAYNSPNVQGDHLDFAVDFSEGTYRMDLFVIKDSYCGTVTLKLDGATFTTTDMYAASATPVRISFDVVVPAGARVLSLSMDTKNASSSGYVGQFSRLIFTRGAPLGATA